MTPEFSIEAEWESANHEPEEVRQTAALIGITFGDHVATRVVDDWSKSVHDMVRLAAYPLALWFAASWWRLRWEPAPEKKQRSTSWEMAHAMAASGYGFVWPQLVFESDGDAVEAICRPARYAPTEPIRYLEGFQATVSAKAFEDAIDNFIGLVLARLDAVGVIGTELHALWREVRAERLDAEASVYRRLEARLGFEPDEAPQEVINDFFKLSPQAGDAAIAEIAPACSGPAPGATLAKVIEFANSKGVEGKIKPLRAPLRIPKGATGPSGAPWELGRRLARDARNAWGLKAQLPDKALSEILEVDPKVLGKPAMAPNEVPLGLAVRHNGSDNLRLIFRKMNRTARRFEAARFLADHLLAPAKDHWLPVTDSKTARQKAQRAFAVEFLCPIEELKAFLDGDFSSDDAIDGAGEYFGVSALAIRSHLANNGLTPRF